ncbi:retrovirus-related pol polyprotein from transposon TNT 1-94, partial [Tanacetum coccineum]
MDLCGPMRVESINGKRYVLVIVDDHSSYTWVHFLRLKDEAPEVIKTFLRKIQILLQAPIIIVRTDNGTEFTNQVLKAYFEDVGISHQTSALKTPQQNGIVEQRNQTLVEAARTMMIFSCAPLFLWAEAIATMARYYPKNDLEDIGKLGAKDKKIMETMNVTFDELSAMAFEQRISKPEIQGMTYCIRTAPAVPEP